MPSRPHDIAVLVARTSSLTETFIAREVRGLRSLGLRLEVWGCEDGTRRWRPPVRGALASLVPRTPRGLWLAARAAAVARDLDARIPRRIRHFHGHFLHLPGLVAAELARRRRGVFSLSAHARDIFVPEVDRAALCARAAFVAVCSEHALSTLRNVVPSELRPRLVLHRHGLPLDEQPLLLREMRGEGEPFHLLTVGRMVPKKGLDALVDAVGRTVDRGVDVRWRLIGEGSESEAVRRLLHDRGLSGRTALPGARPVTAEDFAWAHAFGLGCRRAPDGDRDGVPNAVLEALASGLPVVVGRAGGVAEVVHHLRTGWLAEPEDLAGNLAAGLYELATNPNLGRRWGRAGRELIEMEYAWPVTLPPLRALLEHAGEHSVRSHL